MRHLPLICSWFMPLVLLADPPVIEKVAPPSWWVGHSWDPVRLLIQGRNLRNARLSCPQGITAGEVTVSANGNWALANLSFGSDAKPADLTLALETPEGTAAAPFTLLRPLPGKRRFQGFSPDDVIYLIMPDRFANGDPSNDNPGSSTGLMDRSKPRHYHGGDLAGVTKRLPYLRDLGITTLWLTPWYDNVNHLNNLEKYTTDNRRSAEGAASTDYHGYGAVDFYAVEEHFGDMAALRQFVDRAHSLGLKVMQDQVANHTGPYHRWTVDTPTPAWYNGTVADHLENTWQTWTIADPNPPADKLKATLEGWFINLLPDLNQNDPETAAYLIQNSLWWIGQLGLDAVRQDTLPYVPRTYWARWTAALKREHPNLTILGEMWDGNPKLVSFFQGGLARFDGVDSGIDTLFDFPLHYALRDVFAKGQSMKRLSQTLAADTNYVDARVLVTFLGLHDTQRFMNEPGATIAGLKLAFAALTTLRGTPLIYYGDEIALRGGGDPDNRRDFPGGWNEDRRSAFEVGGRTATEENVHSYLSKLLALRGGSAALRQGDLIELAVTDTMYAFARVAPQPGRMAVVAFNNSPRRQSLHVPLRSTSVGKPKSLADRLGEAGRVAVVDDAVTLVLSPFTAAVFTP